MKNVWASIHLQTRLLMSKWSTISTTSTILTLYPKRERMKWRSSINSITYLIRKSSRAKTPITYWKLRLILKNVLVRNSKIINSENYKKSLDLTAFSINSLKRGKFARMKRFRIWRIIKKWTGATWSKTMISIMRRREGASKLGHPKLVIERHLRPMARRLSDTLKLWMILLLGITVEKLLNSRRSVREGLLVLATDKPITGSKGIWCIKKNSSQDSAPNNSNRTNSTVSITLRNNQAFFSIGTSIITHVPRKCYKYSINLISDEA